MRQAIIPIVAAALVTTTAQAQPAPATARDDAPAARRVRTNKSVNVPATSAPAQQARAAGYHRPAPAAHHYPPHYRPPGGGYYRPPPPPPGGWRGGYYPPPRYVYVDHGPTAGQVIAGVAVTSTLIALLASASKPTTAPPPAGTAPPPYTPPPSANGQPAKIAVDLGGLTPEARPSASTCIAEASRQIGATGGLEIGIASFDKVEAGNGGYRLNLTLLATYPDAKRKIPMFCRATPEEIIELKFG